MKDLPVIRARSITIEDKQTIVHEAYFGEGNLVLTPGIVDQERILIIGIAEFPKQPGVIFKHKNHKDIDYKISLTFKEESDIDNLIQALEDVKKFYREKNKPELVQEVPKDLKSKIIFHRHKLEVLFNKHSEYLSEQELVKHYVDILGISSDEAEDIYDLLIEYSESNPEGSTSDNFDDLIDELGTPNIPQ